MRRITLLSISIIILASLLVAAIPAAASDSFVKESSNPVLTGVAATWESGGVSAGSVILDGTTYKMWYTGTDDDGMTRIGYATSADGIIWTKNPGGYVLDISVGQWDSNKVGAPSVIKDGATYKMWYTGASSTYPLIGKIGYATSPDGTTWTKNASYVLDIGASGSWEEAGVLNPSVILDGSTYKMWYTGRYDDGTTLGYLRIGYATSVDGIAWTKYSSNPIVSERSSAFDNRGVGGTYVYKQGPGMYCMYYTGFENGSGLLSEIGYATSNDGISWTREVDQVLRVGSSGGWEEMGVGDPSVLINGEMTYMWYTGTNDEYTPEIGFAGASSRGVPASSNAGTAVMIGGFAILIALGVILGRGRLQRQAR